jgi:hypothetical protein
VKESPVTTAHIDPANPASSVPEPTGGADLLRAWRTVMLFTLTDSFALQPEEIMWAGYHLDAILAPLRGRASVLVPLAVRQEMSAPHPYSAALAEAEAASAPVTVGTFDPSVTHAAVTDWAGVFMAMISGCYPLRPLEEATMRGQIVGVLTELGVGHPSNPRPARYLPNDVRHRLNSTD